MKELIEKLRDSARWQMTEGNGDDEIHRGLVEAADAIEKLTTERDAALAASRYETDLCQQAIEEMDKLKAELTAIHQALTDPENQPNQFGVTMLPPYQPGQKPRSTT